MKNSIIYEKEIYLGKCDYFGDGEMHRCYANIELRQNDNQIVFAATGRVDRICFGQIIDKIYDKLPNEKTKLLNEIWKKYHLNHMHPGCIHQREFENEPYENHENDICPICNYKYGTAWIYEEIPADIIKRIKEL